MSEKKFISEEYLKSLGPIYKCPRGCGGTMIQVYVRYKQGDKARKEYECSKCGKIIKGIPQQTLNTENNLLPRKRHYNK